MWDGQRNSLDSQDSQDSQGPPDSPSSSGSSHSDDDNLNAVFFNESQHGYLLVRRFPTADPNREVQLVRDYQSSAKRFRKRLINQDVSIYIQNRPPEHHFAQRLGGFVNVPDLNDFRGLPNSADYSLIVDFCNGGTLEHFIGVYGEKKRVIPEIFIWHVLRSLTEILAYLHHGFELGADLGEREISEELPPDDWTTVLHKDVSESNILLNFHQSTDAPQSIARKQLPGIFLAGFGNAVEASDHDFDAPGDDDQGDDQDHWSVDIYGLGFVLRRMVVARENDDGASADWEDYWPQSYSAALKRWVRILSQDYSQLPTALNLARRLIPRAREMIDDAYSSSKVYPRKKWIQGVIKKNVTTSSKPILLPRRRRADIHPGERPPIPQWSWRRVDRTTYQ